MTQQEDYPIQKKQDIDLGTEWYPHPKVLAEKVLKCNVSTCSLTIPDIISHDTKTGATTCNVVTLPFYIEEDFGFSLANNWEQACNLNDNAFLNLINSSNMIGGQTQISLQSEIMSTKIWKGSTFEPFTLNCLFVCTNRRVNPLDAVKLLAATCLPTAITSGDPSTNKAFDGMKKLGETGVDILQNIATLATKGFGSLTKKDTSDFQNGVNALGGTLKKSIATLGMRAPLEYGVQIDQDETSYTAISPKKYTTVSMRIGNYFRASDLLVQSVGSVKLSKEVIAPPITRKSKNSLYDNTAATSDYGFPLYAKCTVTLIPFSMVTKQKFESYIQSNTKLNPYTTAKDVLKNAFKLP